MNRMQSIWRFTLRSRRDLLCRCPVFPALSGAPRRHPSLLARRDRPLLTPPASAVPDLLDQLSRFANAPWNVQHNIVVESMEKQVKLDRTNKVVMDEAEMNANGVVMDEAEMNKDVHDNNVKVANDIWPAVIFEACHHRDGSIYSDKWINWFSICRMDITDREETVEPNTLPLDFNCYPDQDNCTSHASCEMIQVFFLSLATTPIKTGSIQLYGYMAARDDMDGKLNYIFNRGRDDPIIVQQGSLMEMTGPKRGIVKLSDLLFEFDMRIKTGEKEEDDIQLIDGVIHYDEHMSPEPTTIRISGNCGGAVDMAFSLVWAVEAVVQVVISEVQSDFGLSVSSILSVQDQPKVQLFDGRAGQMGMRRSVLAVPLDTTMHLKFKIGQEGDAISDGEHYCSFGAKLHGCTHRQIKLEMACITIKVTWSPPW